ncbi:hypothetical protein ABI59_06035 [Acidobacteria bacterium Mor1]|nr:hypothetical protein ABI59_06035 [Acidobacteria bacterium Mor1]
MRFLTRLLTATAAFALGSTAWAIDVIPRLPHTIEDGTRVMLAPVSLRLEETDEESRAGLVSDRRAKFDVGELPRSTAYLVAYVPSTPGLLGSVAWPPPEGAPTLEIGMSTLCSGNRDALRPCGAWADAGPGWFQAWLETGDEARRMLARLSRRPPARKVSVNLPMPDDPPTAPEKKASPSRGKERDLRLLEPCEGALSIPKVLPEHKPQPEYPVEARRKKIGSIVTLEALIRKDGSVDEIKVLSSEQRGYGFEQAAEDAVSRWRYQPARCDGEPVDVYFEVRIFFALLTTGTTK